MASIKTIAFVGLGNMGVPMAAQLAAKGFALALYDCRPEAVRAFAAAHGGRAAASLAEAAKSAMRRSPCCRTTRSCAKWCWARAAGAAGRGPNHRHGHVRPSRHRRHRRSAGKARYPLLGRPVMGGVVFAKDATLDIMAGGSDGDIARCMPVFAAVSRQVFRCGGLGSGHALKALANYVNAGALVTLIEALAIGRKFGLDSDTMANAMVQMCAGRQHPLEKKMIPQVLTHKFATGMALGLIAKDVSIAANFAHSIGAMTPIADRVQEVWGRAEAEIGGHADHTEVARLWEAGNAITL